MLKLPPPPTVAKLVVDIVNTKRKMLVNNQQLDQMWKKWISSLYNFLQVEAVHEIGATGNPAFENSWVNYDSSRKARFYKDPFGRVHLGGVVKTGTVPSTAFTLPEGYRPEYTDASGPDAIFAISSNNAFGEALVKYDGQVIINNGSSAWASLDGISFRAA